MFIPLFQRAAMLGAVTLSAFASAQDEPLHLDDVVVSADPLDASSQHIVRPVSVLIGDDLARKNRSTLADLVENEPGVTSSGFGPGVGRPIIRGQSGARVGVMADGISSMDVSTISPDHAVALAPLFVDQVEILRGPATLLYGGTASGGVVNVLSNQILDYVPENLEGEVVAQYGTASNDTSAGIRLNVGVGQFAFHVDTTHHRAQNLSIPGFERTQPHEEDIAGELLNSDIDNHDTTFGVSWVHDRGFLGLSVNFLDNTYGIPGHTHAHEEEHEGEEEDEHEHGEEHEEEHGDDAAVRLAQKQTRVDLKGEWQDPLPGFSLIKTRWGYNDHTHTESEDGVIGTQLDNKEWQGRVELLHNPIAEWDGVFGLQYQHRDLTTSGEEAFLPSSTLRSIGLFMLERREFDRWHAELGARYEFQEADAETQTEDVSHDLFSFSAGVGYHWTDAITTRLNFTRSQRAPALEELYSNGAHLATNTFEIGSTELSEETSHSLDLTFAVRGDRVRSELTLFSSWIDNFIYLNEQDRNADGIADRVEPDFSGDVSEIVTEEGDPLLVNHEQADARFYGIEINNRITLFSQAAQTLDMRLWADYVRGKLRDGQNLPRITPWRVGAGLDYHHGNWLFYVDSTFVSRARELAELETASDSYVQLTLGASVDLAWSDDVQASWFLRGTNLLDEEIRPQTSFVKDLAPQEGRSVMTGLRVRF